MTSSFSKLTTLKNNAAIPRDFLIFQTWQHLKTQQFCVNSATLLHFWTGLLQFLYLTTSKTNEFCETSFKNGKLSAELTASYQCVLRFFHSTCLKYCACHEKIDASHAKARLNVQKCSVPVSFFALLTWKCALRHNSVHFFNISTSKSAPNLVCFVRFDLEMCFAPQRHAIFHLSSGQLRTRRFSEPTFRPSGATNDWKNSVSRLSYLFAHLHLLSSDSFSSLIFSLLLFSSLWLFPSLLFICPYCRKFDF